MTVKHQKRLLSLLLCLALALSLTQGAWAGMFTNSGAFTNGATGTVVNNGNFTNETTGTIKNENTSTNPVPFSGTPIVNESTVAGAVSGVPTEMVMHEGGGMANVTITACDGFTVTSVVQKSYSKTAVDNIYSLESGTPFTVTLTLDSTHFNVVDQVTSYVFAEGSDTHTGEVQYTVGTEVTLYSAEYTIEAAGKYNIYINGGSAYYVYNKDSTEKLAEVINKHPYVVLSGSTADGSPFSLSDNGNSSVLPSAFVLRISSDAKVEIGVGTTFTNNGELVIYGQLDNKGGFINESNGTVNVYDSGTFNHYGSASAITDTQLNINETLSSDVSTGSASLTNNGTISGTVHCLKPTNDP